MTDEIWYAYYSPTEAKKHPPAIYETVDGGEVVITVVLPKPIEQMSPRQYNNVRDNRYVGKVVKFLRTVGKSD